MLKKALILLSVVGSMSCASCERICRCYKYNGVVEEFSKEELDEKGYSCVELEKNFNQGLTYSLCERVLH